VDPLVTPEQLEHLLALGHHRNNLTTRGSVNLTSSRAVVELAKDVARCRSPVVTSSWEPTTSEPGATGRPGGPGKMFDEANLRPKLAKWLPEPFELRAAIHRVEDCTFAVIYVVEREDGFCIFSDDGKYRRGTLTRSPSPSAEKTRHCTRGVAV
jgi:hypothetical protein